MINAMGSAPSPQTNNQTSQAAAPSTAPVATKQPVPVASDSAPASSSTFKKAPKKLNLKTIIAIVVLLVALVGSVAAFVLSRQSQDVRNQAQVAYPCCVGANSSCNGILQYSACVGSGYCSWDTNHCLIPTNTPRPPATATPRPATPTPSPSTCCRGSNSACGSFNYNVCTTGTGQSLGCTWGCGAPTATPRPATPTPAACRCVGTSSAGTSCSQFPVSNCTQIPGCSLSPAGCASGYLTPTPRPCCTGGTQCNSATSFSACTNPPRGCTWNCGQPTTAPGTPVNCQAGCYDPTPNDGRSECSSTRPHCPNGTNSNCACHVNAGTCEVDANGNPKLYACFYSCPNYYEEVPENERGQGCPPSLDWDGTWNGYCRWYSDRTTMERDLASWKAQSYCGVRQWDSCMDESWSEFGPPCEDQPTPPPSGPQCNNIQLLNASNQVLTGSADSQLRRGSVVHFQCGATGSVHHYEFRVMQANGTITSLAATGAISANYTLPVSGRYAAQCRVCTSATECHPYEAWPVLPTPPRVTGVYVTTGALSPRPTAPAISPTPTSPAGTRERIDWGTGTWNTTPYTTTGLPGSGDVQALTMYQLPDGTYQQGLWRGNQGFSRTVPVSGNTINWNGAGAWSAPNAITNLPGSGNMQALTTYRLPNGSYQQGLWRGNQGFTRTVPVANGTINWSAASAWSAPIALSNLPGTGDIQLLETFAQPSGASYLQILARNNVIWFRTARIVNGALVYDGSWQQDTDNGSFRLNPPGSSGNLQVLSIYANPDGQSYGVSLWKGNQGWMKNVDVEIPATHW